MSEDKRSIYEEKGDLFSRDQFAKRLEQFLKVEKKFVEGSLVIWRIQSSSE